MSRIFGALSARYPKLVQSLTALILVLSLPLLVFAARSVQNLVQRASSSDVVKILNANEDPITETIESTVKLKITLPSDWTLEGDSSPKVPDQQDGAFLPIQKAYADEDDSVNQGSHNSLVNQSTSLNQITMSAAVTMETVVVVYLNQPVSILKGNV